MKPLVPENINVNVNTGVVADLADLSVVVADSAMFVIAGFTVCSIIRTVVRSCFRK